MKSIGVEELVKNFMEKLDNITNQGEKVDQQTEEMFRLKWKVEGGKEILGALISEFQPEEEKVEDKKE
jgi:hypothetical protein